MSDCYSKKHSRAHSFRYCLSTAASNASMAKLSSCERDHIAHKAQNIYYLDLYRKGLLTLAAATQGRLAKRASE